MLIRRTLCFAAAGSFMGAGLGLATTQLGDEFPSVEKVPRGNVPGDLGYLHDKYHNLYQQLFADVGKCSCGVGDCRVSDWRETILGSRHGYDVIVDRVWHPLPDKVWIPLPHQVPRELRQERAHVCAFLHFLPRYYTSINCVVINVTNS